MMQIQANQRTSGIYTATLVDETGTAVPAATLTALTLSLYDQASGDFLNGRQLQNVKNTNQVTIDAQGHLTWNWLPADTDIVDTTKAVELHTAAFAATWIGIDGLTRETTHEVVFRVKRVLNIS